MDHRVGSPVALSNLAEDLQISPKTAKAWLEVLERVYFVFCVRPYTRNLTGADVSLTLFFFGHECDARAECAQGI